MSQLAVKGLGNEIFLKSISLTSESSECICISGPSGSGKTMLLRALADLDPHNGEVLLDGVNKEKFTGPQWRRKVGYFPSESHWWHERVGEHFYSIDNELLSIFGFEKDVMDWNVSRLSSGQRQRLALIRLLCNNPVVLLLDEPTSNLDPDNVLRVEKVIKTYQNQNSAVALWVSHDKEQIKRVSKRHFSMNGGSLTRIS